MVHQNLSSLVGHTTQRAASGSMIAALPHTTVVGVFVVIHTLPLCRAAFFATSFAADLAIIHHWPRVRRHDPRLVESVGLGMSTRFLNAIQDMLEGLLFLS